MSYLEVFEVSTRVGVDVSKFIGVRARVLKRGTGAESKSDKGDSTHLCQHVCVQQSHLTCRVLFSDFK